VMHYRPVDRISGRRVVFKWFVHREHTKPNYMGVEKMLAYMHTYVRLLFRDFAGCISSGDVQ